MNIRFLRNLIIVLIMSFSCVVAATAQDDKTIHIIKRGETIESVANKYGISIEDLIKANPSANDYFYIGMKLTIPDSVDKKDEKTVPLKVENPIATDTSYEYYKKDIEKKDMNRYSNYGVRYNAPFESAGSGYYALESQIYYYSGLGLVMGIGSNMGIVDINYASVSFILGPAYAYKYNNILLSSAIELVGNYIPLSNEEKDLGLKSFTMGFGLCPKVGFIINRVIPSLGVDFMIYPGNSSKIIPCFNIGIKFIIK